MYHEGVLTNAEQDYIRGWVPFLETRIFLDSRPLIPRTETEYWVEQAIQEMSETNNLCVLDIFAGSGCAGLATLKHRPNAFVTFAEIEEAHLDTIKKSISENDLNKRHAFFIESDVWENVDGRFDFIFANPPYISKERNTVEKEVVTTEPSRALFAEEDGYAYIRETIQGLSSSLANKGVCYIEHEPFHVEKIEAQIKNSAFTATTKKDQYGVDRFTRIIRSNVS